MRFILLLPLAIIAASPAGARRAELAPASASIAWKHGPKPRLVVGDKFWSCKDKECSGALDADVPQARAAMCRALARAAGKVLRFETASGAMAEAELQTCNEGLN